MFPIQRGPAQSIFEPHSGHCRLTEGLMCGFSVQTVETVYYVAEGFDAFISLFGAVSDLRIKADIMFAAVAEKHLYANVMFCR